MKSDEINKERKLPGRPKKNIADLSLTKQISFYWNNKHGKLFNIFENLCKQNAIVRKVYPERCVTEILKMLVATYVEQNSENEEDRQLATKFIELESDRLYKMVKREGVIKKIQVNYKSERRPIVKKVKPVKKEVIEEEPEIMTCKEFLPTCPYLENEERCLEHQSNCLKQNSNLIPNYSKDKNGNH